MGRLVVLEGLDGSGKRTLTARLAQQQVETGRTVATLAFPRYGASVYADLVQEALYGRHGDLVDSAYGMAMLFALDRKDAAGQIRDMLERNDVVLLDRYISSNAAYGSARTQDAGFADWVQALEVGRFGVPVPELQILLDTPVEVSETRTRSRAEGDPERQLDRWEADAALQHRTATAYRKLAAGRYLSPWQVIRPDGAAQVNLLATEPLTGNA